MKEGILCGLLVGMIAGAILVKTCKPVEEVMDQGEKEIKKAMRNMKKAVAEAKNDTKGE